MTVISYQIQTTLNHLCKQAKLWARNRFWRLNLHPAV